MNEEVNEAIRNSEIRTLGLILIVVLALVGLRLVASLPGRTILKFSEEMERQETIEYYLDSDNEKRWRFKCPHVDCRK